MRRPAMEMPEEKRVLPAIDRKAIDAYIDAHYIRKTAAAHEPAAEADEYGGLPGGVRFSVAPADENCVILGGDTPEPGVPRPVRNREDILSAVRKDGFAVRLQELMEGKGMSAADVYRRAEIYKSTFSKILNDRDYNVGRDTAIQICIALGLTRDEANALLMPAGYTLARSSLRDVIIEYCMENRCGKVVDVDLVLHEYHCRPFVKK